MHSSLSGVTKVRVGTPGGESLVFEGSNLDWIVDGTLRIWDTEDEFDEDGKTVGEFLRWDYVTAVRADNYGRAEH